MADMTNTATYTGYIFKHTSIFGKNRYKTFGNPKSFSSFLWNSLFFPLPGSLYFCNANNSAKFEWNRFIWTSALSDPCCITLTHLHSSVFLCAFQRKQIYADAKSDFALQKNFSTSELNSLCVLNFIQSVWVVIVQPVLKTCSCCETFRNDIGTNPKKQKIQDRRIRCEAP